MKRVSVLGSTGSVGRQALEVLTTLGRDFDVVGLAAGRNKELLLQQAIKFRPRVIALAGKEEADWLTSRLDGATGIEVTWGQEGLNRVATLAETDIVLNALSGAVGLAPTIKALEAGKDIALANKETLVAAGALVMDLAQRRGCTLLPVDSEHSAIWQCLQGSQPAEVAKIILTASGGPFRTYAKEQLAKVTPAQALKHPNWNMGHKITVDSATLMNKGLEVIEARWLFGMDYSRIQVIIHPQSIIHSMVEYVDGSVIAQLGVPDMRLPIQYALTYPRRLQGSVPGLSWPVGDLTFEMPDLKRFPALRLAYEAGYTGGTMPAVLNAANEVAVEQFLAGRLSFTGIPLLVEKVMAKHSVITAPKLEDILEADRWARESAKVFAEVGMS